MLFVLLFNLGYYWYGFHLHDWKRSWKWDICSVTTRLWSQPLLVSSGNVGVDVAMVTPNNIAKTCEKDTEEGIDLLPKRNSELVIEVFCLNIFWLGN